MTTYPPLLCRYKPSVSIYTLFFCSPSEEDRQRGRRMRCPRPNPAVRDRQRNEPHLVTNGRQQGHYRVARLSHWYRASVGCPVGDSGAVWTPTLSQGGARTLSLSLFLSACLVVPLLFVEEHVNGFEGGENREGSGSLKDRLVLVGLSLRFAGYRHRVAGPWRNSTGGAGYVGALSQS